MVAFLSFVAGAVLDSLIPISPIAVVFTRLLLISSAIVSFFNLGAWAALYTYTPELYPTSMRGTGAGSAASIGRLAGIAAPALTGYIWSVWGLSIAFVVFAAVHIINAGEDLRGNFFLIQFLL